MRTVRDADGRTYLLVKRSSDASRVRDPETGEERYLPNDELEDAGGESALDVAAGGVPEPVRRVVVATPSDRALGLLVELVDRGPRSAIDLLDAYDLCESDLHGVLTGFKLAGLVVEAEVHGQRGYEATALAEDGVDRLRGRAGE